MEYETNTLSCMLNLNLCVYRSLKNIKGTMKKKEEVRRTGRKRGKWNVYVMRAEGVFRREEGYQLK